MDMPRGVYDPKPPLIPVYFDQNDRVIGTATVTKDQIVIDIKNDHFLGVIRDLSVLIRGFRVGYIAGPVIPADSRRTMIGLRHKGSLGCPVEGCDGQTCEEGETS